MQHMKDNVASTSISTSEAAGTPTKMRKTQMLRANGSSEPSDGVNEARGKKIVSNGNELSRSDMQSRRSQSNKSRVGVLALQEGALEIGDDGRAVVWLDIDNTLYSKKTDIARHMTSRIRNYIIGLGMGEEEADRLHRKYYKEYGLAIRGLVMHHKIDALEYDAKCDATLPLEELLRPDGEVKEMLRSLDRSKCRVWALTNAYKTHAMRVLKLLELDQFIEGVIYCDYAQEKFACKPEVEFYDAALEIVGLKDASRCYFVDDSSLNIQAAKKLGWAKCVLFDETESRSLANGSGISVTSASTTTSTFDPALLIPHSSAKSSFDVTEIQAEFRRLPQSQRVEMLQILLEACQPEDLMLMSKTLEKHLRLTRDMISNLPDDVLLRVFEKLSVKDLLGCQVVSKRWRALAADPSLWRSHALALTEGDPVAMIPPVDPSGWAPSVRGLYHRERNWRKGVSQSITLMRGHTGFVTAMKLKGRRTLVTGSYDETIRVWELLTGECKKVLTAKAISCLDFLDEEGILAAGLYDSGRVMIWDMKTWTLLQTLSGHNRGIRHVSINQNYLVSVGQDKTIVVWDWKTGNKIVRFGQQSNVSLGVSFADHDKIVAVTVDGIIRTFCIRRKEMIGQHELAKLSPALASQLSGLKDGSTMMQWFAAHRDTLTLASQNIVVHLRWQEHIVPILQTDDSKISPTRSRSDSISSINSTESSLTSRGSLRGSLSATNSTTTPTKPKTTSNESSTMPTARSSTGNLNRLMTPSRFQTPSKSSPQRSPIALSPVSWPKPPQSESSRQSMTSSNSSANLRSPLPSPARSLKNGHGAVAPAESSATSSSASLVAIGVEAAATRIAPDLSSAPVVVDILQTPDAAVGCIDPFKKRVILASRFSSRAGADRKIYTSTMTASTQGEDAEKGKGLVVPIVGAWQAQADELATPARNPMSIVMDHENCVVGTSEGLVYRIGFVGSEYQSGGKSEEEALLKDLKAVADNHHGQANKGNDNVVITDLLHLRTAWKELFL